MKTDLRYQRRSGILLQVVAFAVLLFACAKTRGSVAVLLEEPYGGMGRMNPTGHSAIYLDHVCAETPTMLRPCREGELGAVISRYDGIAGYDWLAMPLIPYLYAVDAPEDIPLTADRVIESRLRNEYRREHLLAIAPDLPNGAAPGGNWYELVGSAYDRTIYEFQVKSTPEQDAELIALFNDRRNVERYNGAFRNCADFSRVTINRFYPHSVRRNFVADFGLTTPKSVARALAHYAEKHPEAGLQVFKIPQVKGEIPRSHATQGVAESLLKDYGLPLVWISPVTASVVLAAYIQHGRFSLPKDMEVLDFRAGANPLIAAQSATNSRAKPAAVEVSAQTTPAVADMPKVDADAGKKAEPVKPAVSSGDDFAPVFTVSPLFGPIGIVSTANRNWQ